MCFFFLSFFPTALVVPQKNEQDTDPCPALQPESCATAAATQEFPGGAANVRLYPAAVLATPPGRPGLLHKACPGGQERTLQAVQLRLGQKRQALPQRVPKARQEGRVSGAGAAGSLAANLFILLTY